MTASPRPCEVCKALLETASIFCPQCGYANLEGQMAGSYRLQARLGAGGMGVVYRAEHEKLGTAFAIKVLHKALASKPDVAKRFLQEAKATSRLRHEHIIFLADYGEIPGVSPYIAMEYLDGQPLSNVLEQTPILPFRRTFAILEQVCETMRYAHREGIIHRDLKPDNLFLLKREEGQRDFVKILDFGIAKILESEDTQLTKTGSVLGTPHYISPEQVLGREIDHRADVFAAAVILFQMLTGKFPYDGGSVIEILSRRLLTEAPLLSAIHPRWKGSPTEALIQDGLRMNKNQRLPSMQDFFLRLQDALPSAQDIEKTILLADLGSLKLSESIPTGALSADLIMPSEKLSSPLLPPQPVSPNPAASPIAVTSLPSMIAVSSVFVALLLVVALWWAFAPPSNPPESREEVVPSTPKPSVGSLASTPRPQTSSPPTTSHPPKTPREELDSDPKPGVSEAREHTPEERKALARSPSPSSRIRSPLVGWKVSGRRKPKPPKEPESPRPGEEETPEPRKRPAHPCGELPSEGRWIVLEARDEEKKPQKFSFPTQDQAKPNCYFLAKGGRNAIEIQPKDTTLGKCSLPLSATSPVRLRIEFVEETESQPICRVIGR